MKELNINAKVIEDIKETITKNYGNLKNFSNVIGIKYTTLRDLLSENIGKSRVENVVKICKFLNVPIENLYNEDTPIEQPEPPKFTVLARNFEKLDEKDKTVILKLIESMLDEENN